MNTDIGKGTPKTGRSSIALFNYSFCRCPTHTPLFYFFIFNQISSGTILLALLWFFNGYFNGYSTLMHALNICHSRTLQKLSVTLLLFMTIGPCQGTGSLMGFPGIRRNHMPFSTAVTFIESPSLNRTRFPCPILQCPAVSRYLLPSIS